MTPTQAFEALDFYTDHERFAETCYTIRDKRGIEVAFKSFQLGQRISQTMRRVDSEGRPGRGICLKPRQGYGSSHIGTEFHRRAAFQPGTHAFVVAQLEDSATKILNYYQQYEESYERAFQRFLEGQIDAPLPIKLKRMGRAQMAADEIKYEQGSWIDVKSAKSAHGARGFSAKLIHLSEASYYGDNFDSFLSGAMGTAPKIPGSWIWMESTANGVGNGFHRLWVEAIGGNSEWEPVFVGTHEIGEYQMELRMPRDQFMESYSKYERSLAQIHGLTPEQVNWRRWVLNTDCRGNVNEFQQEYPYTWEEAFLASGRKYFDMTLIQRQAIAPPSMTGRLEWDEETYA